MSTFKTLGVFFSERMTWDDYVNYITSKLSSIVGLTHINRYFLPPYLKLLIYNSLFYAHLNYGHLVWGSTTLTNLQRIHILQKRMLRNIDILFYQPSVPLFQKYAVMNVHNLYMYRLCLSFKNDATNNTNFFTDLASLRKKTVTYQTRNVVNWSISSCRTNYGAQMLQRKLPEALNFLVKTNISIETVSKTDLRSFFSNIALE